MPTTRPRYVFTDTGEVQEILDAAQERWPEVTDRKQLLLNLAREGYGLISIAGTRAAEEQRQRELREALKRIPSLVDVDVLLSDEPWRGRPE